MTARPLKVLFLTRYPYEGASSRYRVYQYLPHLQALGVHCDQQSFMDSRMYSRYFSHGGSVWKAWLMFRAIIRRIGVLLRFRDYDIIYMQRELFPVAPPLFERYMKRRGAVMFFDYDDALFINKPSRFNPVATFLRSPDKIFELFGLVDRVVAGNDWLRDTAARHGAHAVTLEVAEDTDRIAMHAQHTNDKPLTIGWLGSTSTVKYLRIIAPVLERIAADYPEVRFELMGGGDFCIEGVPFKASAWSLEEELAALARFDIGLMPLPDEDWARGKSGGKARTYMAAGVVPVCSAIGYNLQLVDHGRTGYLCRDAEEWYTAITTLLGDPQLRQSIAVQARAEVVSRFSPSGQALRMRALFDDALAARATGDGVVHGN
ncbi:MAG: glycosyltransferase family 4 protein [Halioglobus sp.]|nr:glycosyltransferase family 4 protein [Halioglobus sp.]